MIIGDLPAGAMADRLGERRAMIVSVLAVAAALAGCMLAPSVLALGASILVIGVASAVFTLARLTYLAETLPVHARGRGMSTLGGAYRIGLAIGPFAGAWASRSMGTDGAYLVHLVAAAATLALVWFLPDMPAAGDGGQSGGDANMWDVLHEHRRVLATTGVAALLVGAARSARITVIPLWCEHAGLDVAQTSLVVGVSGVVEIVLFYPAGAMMDGVGRGAAGATSMLLVAAGLAVMPAAHRRGGLAGGGVRRGRGARGGRRRDGVELGAEPPDRLTLCDPPLSPADWTSGPDRLCRWVVPDRGHQGGDSDLYQRPHHVKILLSGPGGPGDG